MISNDRGGAMAEQLKLFFLSPEVVPFAKTGGLADVAGALPGALKKLGVDVRVGLPYYRMIKEQSLSTTVALEGLDVPLGDQILKGNVRATETEDGIPVYLFEREDLFDRPNLYGTPEGDYYDNFERFAFFSQAALLFAKEASFDFDVVHCHDWQTALVPAYLQTLLKADPFFSTVVSVFTIHNIGYQGVFPPDKLSICGLPTSAFRPDGLEFWGNISLLKAGIVYSDAITTVSPRYSQEIQTPEYGMGMEGILHHRRASLYGILNGVDYRLWDPGQDAHIPHPYSLQEMGGKIRCKQALMEEMRLDSSLKDRPLLGMISRLSAQKGLDLLVQVLDDILDMDVGLAVLGSGDEKVQTAIAEAAQRHPGRVGLKIGFDEPLAHRIMAGADIFLIPSHYEPCGLTQMYGLKYGTVPVVRATGGLDDTIVPFDARTGEGNGFKFGPYKAKAFLETVRQALALFNDGKTWKRLTANGMRADFSWDRSAQSYLDLYHTLLRR
jgi:starch synthase